MPKDQRRRQQKLIKKRRKEKAKRKRMHRAGFGGDAVLSAVRNARKYPILECLINASWKESGAANIVVARKQPNGLVVFGVYLVDMLCLGLKDTFFNANMPLSEYATEIRGNVEGTPEVMIPCDPSLAHQIVYGGIDYAATLGFKPHKDYARSQNILDPKEIVTFDADLEFGRNGKPLYISGPHDPVNRILNHLENTLGRGNFEFIVGLSPSDDEDYKKDHDYDDGEEEDEDEEDYDYDDWEEEDED